MLLQVGMPLPFVPSPLPNARPVICHSNLVGPRNIPLPAHAHARYKVQVLTGPRLAQLRLSEGSDFYGNEFIDPFTGQPCVLRVLEILPDSQEQGAPRAYFQPPQPPTTQYPAAAFYPSEEVPVVAPYPQANLAPMAPSTFPSPHHYSSWAANYAPAQELPFNAPMAPSIVPPLREYSTYAPAPPVDASFMAPPATSYVSFPVTAVPQMNTAPVAMSNNDFPPLSQEEDEGLLDRYMNFDAEA